MKKTLIAIAAALTLALSACSGPSGPYNPDGGWVNQGSGQSFEAEISSGEIEIYLILEGSKGLYWSGTFPTEVTPGETVTSEADVEALESSLFGSLDPTKDFNISGDSISYDFTIMGTTETIALKRG